MTQAVLVRLLSMNAGIKNELERVPLFWFFSASAAVLSVVSITSHFSLIFNGIVLMNSDYAFQSLEADEFRRGAWSAFSTGQNYGGVLLSALRPFWTAAWESIFAQRYPSWVAHTSFTFALSPVLVTLASFYLIQAYCSRLAALATGFIGAVGFQFWVTQYGNDFYIAYILLCMVLLAWRAGVSHPLVELSYQKLLFAGIISGLALYTYRGSFIYVFVFFFPIGVALQALCRITSPEDRIERMLLGAAITFSILFFCLWIFGQFTGTVNGQKIEIRAVPNLIFCIGVTGVLLLKAFWKHLNVDIWYRTAVVALGGVIGLLPEIVYCFEQRSFPNRLGTLSSIETFISVAGMVPATFRTLVSGDNAFGQSLTQHVSIILFLWAGFCLIKRQSGIRNFNLSFWRERCRCCCIAWSPDVCLWATEIPFPHFPGSSCRIGSSYRSSLDQRAVGQHRNHARGIVDRWPHCSPAVFLKESR